MVGNEYHGEPYVSESKLLEEVGVVVGIDQRKLSGNSTSGTGQERRAKGVERRHFRIKD